MQRPVTSKPRRKLVVGNWKMHGSLAALTVLGEINAVAKRAHRVEVAIAVPATLITAAWQAASAVKIGAQEIHAVDQGPHTGCLSASMIKDAGGGFSIIGHSECRQAQQQTDSDILEKALAARRHGLSVILCVGENLEMRERGRGEAFVMDQLEACVPADADGDWFSVAYEPIWAIGTGLSASMDDIAQMHAGMRAMCRAHLGAAGDRIRLLYGGSVSSANASQILSIAHVDGVLVSGASLSAEAFLPIIAAA